MVLCLPQNSVVNKKNIIEYLAREIISGKLKHNDIVPNEIDIAANFGVSRTMIRDVLKSLEMKGLIERRTNVGARVRSINSWNLLDSELLDWSSGLLTSCRFLVSLKELRLIIELQAARLKAIRASDKRLLQLRADLSRMLDRNPDTNAVRRNTDADSAFHECILKASGNLLLFRLGSAIRGALRYTIYFSNKINMEHQESYECHHQVLNAVENRDSQRAYKDMCRVLNNSISEVKLQLSGVILSGFERITLK